ncbi:MAG: CDP-alcohol phosphatidyltransferase family protein [Deltaproteobacteria bacterium]
MEHMSEVGSGMSGAKSRTDFLNYFGRDRYIHLWLAEKRTRLVSALFPPFIRLGLVPDTISYLGLSFLVGVILYFVRNPILASVFLSIHVVCDGLDGAYARNTGKASQSGAFTDLVCDQLGMITVALLAVFHHLVHPLLGTIYITLYLVVVVFGVIINVMGLGTRITITSKYFLYGIFGIWAFFGPNYFPFLMTIFSGIMAMEVVVGYLRLKRGIRKKFESRVRFTAGDPYSSKLNYALNVAVPLTVLIVIVAGANRIPVRAFYDKPTHEFEWSEGQVVLSDRNHHEILGFGVRDGNLLIVARGKTGHLMVRELGPGNRDSKKSFPLPGYFDLAFPTLPVDDGVLLVADRSTRLLMGIDLDASFTKGRAVMVLTLPMGHLRVTAMATARRNGKKVWLVAGYLYTRTTYVVDPVKARNKGYLLAGVEASYINGAFPSGLTVRDDLVIELNRSPLNGLVYLASLSRLLAGSDLLDASEKSFRPPGPDCLGPVIEGNDLVMLSPRGQVFRLPMSSFRR